MKEKDRNLLIILENVREIKMLLKNNPNPEIQEVIVDTEKRVREILNQ